MSLGKNKAAFKLSTANVLLVANAFVWYFITFNTLKGLVEKLPNSSGTIVFGVNLGAIVLSGLIGSFFVDKLKKREHFLFIWIAIGIVLSLIPIGLDVSNVSQIILIALVFGFYFGLGMPATMGYHSALTDIEGRAKIGGLTFLVIGVSSATIGVIVSDNLVVTCLVLASVRVAGLLFFHFMSGKEKPYEEKSKVKFRSIISDRSFILYFIPWLMISLINYMTVPILSANPNSNYDLLSSWEIIIIAVVAVISGFLADRWGRKRITIIGFVMLGIGYAAIGLTNGIYPFLGTVIYTVVDGVAWGIFDVLFLFTLWGDLSQNRNSDKFYFLGALPFVSSYVIKVFFAPVLKGINMGTIFSFASVFLFIAVLPLIYAPETLPDKKMKDRELKNYIAKAQKIANKEEKNKKHYRNKTPEEPTADELNEECSEEYNKGKELAEKYY